MFKVMPFGDGAIHVQFGTTIDPEVFQRVRLFCTLIKRFRDPRIVEFIPSYHSVTIFYGTGTTFQEIAKWVDEIMSTGDVDGQDKTNPTGRLIKIPVCYGGEYGPDLDCVAQFHNFSPKEVIQKHTGAEYLVYMIGFMPGFPFMGGLDPELATPRLSRPRSLVPKGSVGIAGAQTGLYPLDSPGGWQLIGRTPLIMFNAQEDPPTLLQSGDRVRFVSITPEEYLGMLQTQQK